MKTSLKLGVPMILLSSVLLAQSTSTSPGDTGAPARDTPPASTSYDTRPLSNRDVAGEDWNEFGTRAGDHEFTLAGTGVSNDDLDNSAGGLAASLGYYLNDTLELSFRQSVDYINPDSGDDGWAGASSVAIDQHLGAQRLRPFVGASAGYLYGDETEESFFAGLEGGLKFHVQPRTFLFARAEYIWAFDDTDDADDTFEDGGFRWTAGVGFLF